jgi:hypothetical protein
MDTWHDRSKLFRGGADTHHRSISHINDDADRDRHCHANQDRDCDGYDNSDCVAIAYSVSTL